MIRIDRFTCEGMGDGCVTDEKNPSFSFTLTGDQNEENKIESVKLTIGDYTTEASGGSCIRYDGPGLVPRRPYRAQLNVRMDDGQTAQASLHFWTGFLGTKWQGSWITAGSYRFRQKKCSPVPMTFQRRFTLRRSEKPVRALLYATAIGTYQAYVNTRPAADRFFAPGFTDYTKSIQYQTMDVTELLDPKGENELLFYVAGGWAVGSFGFTRKNRIYADRQALLGELHIEYADGTTETIGTDESFLVSMDGPFREADLYDGEVYDGTVEGSRMTWRHASIEHPRIHPALLAEYGSPVGVFDWKKPVSVQTTPEGLLYDFGQNMAAVLHLRIRGKRGQQITARHAELLDPSGKLQTDFLRTAKARFVYTCRDGEQTYHPTFTYMGFRYALLTGVEEKDVDVEAWALSSDMEQGELFTCSDPRLTRLASNIYWSARSNFVDIPTDCPQRDERMGWTGDIAVFAPTALSMFRMDRFLKKWLKDMEKEQKRTGGIPNTIPSAGFGFPETMPTVAVDFWGDASLLVPYALYRQTGQISWLQDHYRMMKRYVDACRFWAGLFSVGGRRYLWHTPGIIHFGDWVAPDVPKMSQWQGRSVYTATASLARTSRLLARIAAVLGKEEDSRFYDQVADRTAKAYRDYLTDGNGRMRQEFQTAYVLALYFDLLPAEEAKQAAANLARLVRDNGYRIGTGFPGTPYILFALCDNGYVKEAYAMLENTKCPSWLYEVEKGATTVWERWDGLDENGQCPIGDDGTDRMISYNHYASGAVGDFFYRRILGVEAMEAGYRTFRVRPVLPENSSITWARGGIPTGMGLIRTHWEKKEGQFILTVDVPSGATAHIDLPDGSHAVAGGGRHRLACPLAAS